ncbi:MAG: MFS transporter [Chloroflexi bacterium]|nr:MFS transporter [Chloroflexota bacterium]
MLGGRAPPKVIRYRPKDVWEGLCPSFSCLADRKHCVLKDSYTHKGEGTALFLATITSFITPFLVGAINIALPAIGRQFSIDAVTLSWVAQAHILASAAFLVPFGRIADIYGRKRIFTYGLLVYALFALLSALSPTAAWLIAFRALQGVGGAMLFGTAVAVLTSVFPPGERGKALGINLAAVYSGLSLGPVVGGLLTERFGWRSIFVVTVVLALVTIIITLSKLKGEWAEARGEKFDLAGSAVYVFSLVTLIYGMSLLPAMAGAWLFAGGVLGFALFIWWEMRVRSPVINVHIFRNNPVFAFSNLAALINYSATFAVSFQLSLYLQYIKGLTAEQAGLVLIAQPVVMAISSPVAGRLSDRTEPVVVASIGMALTAVGLAIFIFLGQTTSLGLILGNLVLLGLGFGLFSSPNTNAIMGAVEKRFYGVASGVVGTMRTVGMMFSLGIAALLFTLYMGRVPITPEYYPLFLQSLRTAFVIFTILCFGGIFASLARGRIRDGHKS